MFRSSLVLSSIVLALVAAVTASARPSAQHGTTVNVTARDFSFALSAKTVKAGRVTFVIRNASSSIHDFSIAGHTSKSIGRGQTTRLTVTLKPGRYPYECTVDDHAGLGMKGALQVRR